jgi:hypothetical protein
MWAGIYTKLIGHNIQREKEKERRENGGRW